MPYTKRFDAKRDANELEIVEALEEFGASIERHDTFDLFVGFKGKTFLMEIKNPDTDWSLTKKQKAFLNTWAGCPLYIVTNKELAINIVSNY